MISIQQFKGKDKELYQRVAPLVMDPEVLKKNRNYPFKTGDNFIWYVAIEEENDTVVGFVPVEIRIGQAIVNNYYTEDDNPEILSALLKKTIQTLKNKTDKIIAIVQKQHQNSFRKKKFEIEQEWTNYIKMSWQG